MSVVIPEFLFDIQQGDRWYDTITIYQNMQTVTLLDVVGTFRLSLVSRNVDGTAGVRYETGSMADDVTAADMQEQLETLPNVGPGNVSVTGSAGGPYTVTFIGDLDGLPQFKFAWSADEGLVEVDYVAEDLSSGTAHMVGRPHIDSPLVLFDLTTGGSPPNLTLDSSGVITIDVPAATTAGWNFETGVCDCKVTLGGVTRTRFSGRLALTEAVTR